MLHLQKLKLICKLKNRKLPAEKIQNLRLVSI